MDERFCKVDALGCAILERDVAVLESPMNLDFPDHAGDSDGDRE
jgi:hypothetical protein